MKKVDKGIYATNDDIINQTENVDAIIFDCDGVLIDIRKSYDLAIIKATDYILKKLDNNTTGNLTKVDSDIIDAFKSSGGFNDEVDVTYAAILSFSAAKKALEEKENGGKSVLKQFVLQIAKNSDKSGIVSVEHYIEQQLGIDISDIKQKLNYPSDRKTNFLCSVFDQLFYGPKLYQKIFGKKPDLDIEKKGGETEVGLVENDVVIVSEELLDKLERKFGKKMAIVSGRGYESVKYSLKDLVERFDVGSSAFLEDEPRNIAKPNPEPLIGAIKQLNSTKCMFVGDSIEDHIMAKEATNQGYTTIFCGIIGTSDNPHRKLGLFEQNNVGLVLDSIQKLPKVLNLV